MNILSIGTNIENNIELILCITVIYIIITYTFKLILYIKICDNERNTRKSYQDLEIIKKDLEEMKNAHAYEISQIEDIIRHTEVIEKSLSKVDNQNYIIK